MENATKALLIAGSVLIAILLIAMGLRIFNSTSETTQQSESTMNATAITTFNSQFTEYLGTNISASKARTLVQKIIASNAANKPNHYVTFQGGDPTEANPGGGTYSATYDDDGYIIDIH